MPSLLVIIASTRPGRVGLPVGTWFAQTAREDGRFDVQVADLAEIDLPMMDEPNHPRLQQYTHEHTRAWSATVAAADAFALVMPEYNNGYTAPLKNAIDYLAAEWRDKPVGVVSYGGIAGGTRAVQLLKPVLLVCGMTPVGAAVTIPSVPQYVQDGVFTPSEPVVSSAQGLLTDLARMDAVLRPLRG